MNDDDDWCWWGRRFLCFLKKILHTYDDEDDDHDHAHGHDHGDDDEDDADDLVQSC